jgi:hypothetical protein
MNGMDAEKTTGLDVRAAKPEHFGGRAHAVLGVYKC